MAVDTDGTKPSGLVPHSPSNIAVYSTATENIDGPVRLVLCP